MMLSEVINSHTPLREKFAVRSKEDYEILQHKLIEANLHQGQLRRHSYGKSVSTLRDNDTRPAKFPLFCDYKGRLSRRSRVRGYQVGTGGLRLRAHAKWQKVSISYSNILAGISRNSMAFRAVTLSVARDGESDLQKATRLPKWSPRNSRR
jgi:hypothetical protein